MVLQIVIKTMAIKMLIQKQNDILAFLKTCIMLLEFESLVCIMQIRLHWYWKQADLTCTFLNCRLKCYHDWTRPRPGFIG